MVWDAALGVVGEIASTHMVNEANRKEAKKQRDWSSREAATARDFTERMSNTAHQRKVIDMRKAGLNPILAAGGGGAVTPSASAPSGTKADMKKAELAAAANAAADLKVKNQSARLLDQQRKKAAQDTQKSYTETENLIVNRDILQSTAEGIALDNKRKAAEMVETLLKSDVYSSSYGSLLKNIEVWRKTLDLGAKDLVGLIPTKKVFEHIKNGTQRGKK